MKIKKYIAYTALITTVGIGSMAFSFSDKQKAKVTSEIQNELANHPLEISGQIPSWLSGTLVRNGPINVSVNGQKTEHWFDGLAMLHAFSFQDGKVKYSNKFLKSDAYQSVFEEGSLKYKGFASDPCRSLFKKFLTFFISDSHVSIKNANVNVAKIADSYVALTEVPLPVKFDPETLDTLGVLDYKDELPKDSCWESAHPHYDTDRKSTYNYLVKFGRTSTYTLYNLEEGSSQRKILSEVPVSKPSYMHSFAMTENYVIFTEFPFVVSPLDLLTSGKAFIKNFTWQPERGTQFIVINKHNGDLIGKYKAKPFFAFHHANAFEKDGMIHLDIVTYEDAKILLGTSLYVNSDKTSDDDSSKLERFSLSLSTGKITAETLIESSTEFPRINDHLDGKPYKYVYSVGFADKMSSNERLYKCDTQTKNVLPWSEAGCSFGEPVFVAAPNAKEEDEGVILALVFDQIHGDSFLVILDAKTFKELGRAKAPHVIPKGFHGQYFD